jgi:glycosyltransferase involved in cell wall biosynthesis
VNRPLDLVLVNQFYPPDLAPTGIYLHDLARLLARRGHRVTVICSELGYDGGGPFMRHERMDGVSVLRLPAWGSRGRGLLAKLARYVCFHLLCAMALLARARRPDAILSLTTPPWMGLVTRFAAIWHRAAHLNWVMDLYPDVVVAHRRGWFPGLGLAARLTRRELAGARLIVAPAAGMAARVDRYLAPGAKRSVGMPLWMDQRLSPWSSGEPNPTRARHGWGAEDLVLMYSGNLGAGHRFGEFLEAARRLEGRGPVWAFAGAGRRRADVERFAAEHPRAKIQLLPYADRADLRAHLAAADVHLASLEPAWDGAMVPSKLQGIFAVGRPVIFVGSRTSDIAKWIAEARGGWIVAPGDVDGLLGAVAAASDPAEAARRGTAARAFAERVFDPRNCLLIASRIESSCGLPVNTEPSIP